MSSKSFRMPSSSSLPQHPNCPCHVSCGCSSNGATAMIAGLRVHTTYNRLSVNPRLIQLLVDELVQLLRGLPQKFYLRNGIPQVNSAAPPARLKRSTFGPELFSVCLWCRQHVAHLLVAKHHILAPDTPLSNSLKTRGMPILCGHFVRKMWENDDSPMDVMGYPSFRQAHALL